jgi:hypothetical protein
MKEVECSVFYLFAAARRRAPKNGTKENIKRAFRPLYTLKMGLIAFYNNALFRACIIQFCIIDDCCKVWVIGVYEL